MPVYEYLCDTCGDFTAMRPMSEYSDPQPCPDCGALAPRVLLTAPHSSSMSRARFEAHAVNERASHAPMTSDEYKAKHGAGCACCSGGLKSKKKRPMLTTTSGAKSFPTARPWMISH
ncbi:FmdB family zinc ribbon protein [Beijerinckia indica]|uniref:Regulatory protein, FmdB family n=1 Tax=Beijerinckia indica subsp. indica (strain ATCC 9039 / DSM 1715 / NCIMB 8712) TaxID=395963 RepID=B2II43_BEII9|nr:zinc ribbon domain-containing protein [Beijerinckia indica]ACB94626.1 regulatory protein, FmdB family [Beijerinckia indica subsp. indica ATCC 9039]